MPTYDYECQDCGYKFEKFQSITEQHLTNCPQCDGKVKRLIGLGAGIIFKGSGFYCTDYKTKEKPSKTSDSCASCCDAKKNGNCPNE